MRYAVFSDIHANLEALEAVLAKIDELSQKEPIDEIWFLGDLVGYGPNPNECIEELRERTNVIIVGNHDWAAVGKIDLEDFSPAARISAEWTARQLTEEHRDFLANLPERLEFGECTLVHGSPYGPLWEYLTSEQLAERSFQYFKTRYCFVGHTHVPIIFQQAEDISNAPTTPLQSFEQNGNTYPGAGGEQHEPGETNGHDEDEHAAEKAEKVAVADVLPSATNVQIAAEASSAYANPVTGQPLDEQEADILLETRQALNKANSAQTAGTANKASVEDTEEAEPVEAEDEEETHKLSLTHEEESEADEDHEDEKPGSDETEATKTAPAPIVIESEEDLLKLFYLSQSLVEITNEMSIPPEGPWQAKEGHRAIINPGGVGQPRDGDNRAAFMIYDTERGFEFYRVPYAIYKTQEKIIKAGLPSYLAARLTFGR